MAEFSELEATCLWLLGTTLALTACAYQILAAFAVRRFFHISHLPSSPPACGLPSVTILKPLYGDEPRLAANLESFIGQDYAGAFDIVFGVQRPDDPAIKVVERLIAAYPNRRLVLVRNTAVHGSNLKISNLINMSSEARGDVIVLADSDMSVTPSYLAEVTAALAAPGVGLVTCLYAGAPVGGAWAKLAALAIDHHFLPNVLVGLFLGLAKPCFGSTIALRAETLERIGGFEACANQLADDYAMGAAVRGLGLTVAIPPMALRHTCSEATLRDLLSHELRWQRTIKLVDPAGHIGSLATHALPLAILAACLQHSPAFGFGLIGLALASRLLVQIQVDRVLGAAKTRVGWGPLRDLLSFAVFLTSLVPGTVMWRGHRFGVKTDGTMLPASDEPAGKAAGK